MKPGEGKIFRRLTTAPLCIEQRSVEVLDEFHFAVSIALAGALCVVTETHIVSRGANVVVALVTRLSASMLLPTSMDVTADDAVVEGVVAGGVAAAGESTAAPVSSPPPQAASTKAPSTSPVER